MPRCRNHSKHKKCLRKRAIATGSGSAWQGLESGICPAIGSGGLAANPAKRAGKPLSGQSTRLRPRALAAHALQFHRPVRYRDPERRSDGSFHQMDVAAMGADQFGGDRKAKSAAAGAARGLERL